MSKTIMLVHGAWATTDCWTSFRDFLDCKGHRVVVPAWPYLDGPAEELRRSPDPRLANMTIKGLVDHFEKQIRDLPEQPILIGYSFGGSIVQMLLDRGLGATGVAIVAAPPRGVLPSVTAIRSALPVLLMWRGWRRIASMSFKSFSMTIANTLSQSEQRRAYDRYIVPTPGGRLYFQEALGVGNAVDFENPNLPAAAAHCGERGPHDHAVHGQSNLPQDSRAPSRTDIHEFPNRSHWLIAEPGWEEVADRALKWAEVNAKPVAIASKAP